MIPIPVVALLVTEWTLLGIGLGLVIARLYLRLGLQRKSLHLADYLIILAWVACVGQSTMDILFFKIGWFANGNEWFARGVVNSPFALRVIFFDWIPFFTAPYCNKAALLAFYFSIFPSSLANIRWALWLVVAYCVVSYMVTILLLFLICLPLKENWFNKERGCSLNRQLVLWVVTWVLHLSSDMLIFAVPICIIRKLKLDLRQKIGLFITFGFGVISVAFCILRFVDTIIPYPNILTTNLELWCALDCLTGFFAACLPSLRPYLHHVRSPNSSEPLNRPNCEQPINYQTPASSFVTTLSQPQESGRIHSPLSP